MAKTFKTLLKLQKGIEKSIQEAVMETADIARVKLHDFIDEQYYNDPEFSPIFYQRTMQFLNSAMSSMLSKNSAEIYIDMESMEYKNASPYEVVSWASKSSHGGLSPTSTPDFWTTFIEWCNDNLIELLKNNLAKRGIHIQK